jgi:hypothetical protein
MVVMTRPLIGFTPKPVEPVAVLVSLLLAFGWLPPR